MALSEEDREALKERLRLARERNEQLRAEGLLPPRKKPGRRPRETFYAEDHNGDETSMDRSPPPAPLTDTPEFQAAVAAQVKAQIQALIPTIAGMMPAAPTGTAQSTEETLSKLAMLIAELTDQGSQAPKRIPPDILLARQKAHDRMISLIEKEARAIRRNPQHEPPMFFLTSKIVVPVDDTGDQVLEPVWRGADNRTYPTQLGWLGIPNLAMEPQNESARLIMDAFLESIGNKTETLFKIYDGDPEPNEGIETEFGVTEGGRVVTGGAVQQRKADNGLVDRVSVAMLTARPDLDRAGPGYQRGKGVVMNKGASLRQQQGVAPYRDVRVLGSLAAPARQNG